MDFDVLVEQSRSAVNKTGEQNLWKAALNLPAWYFVGMGAGDDVEPMIGTLDGKPHLMAFTDHERAERFAKHLVGKKGIQEPPVLEMTVAEAVDYCGVLADHKVAGIVFNTGQYAFQAGMIRVADMFKRYTA
jgi:hypothetical protein